MGRVGPLQCYRRRRDSLVRVSNLRKGRIENPGFEKLRAIAKAMGFPPEVEFEEGVGNASEGMRSRSGRHSS